jgi:hypothetical protein
VLLQATGDAVTYEAVQRRFSTVQWGDCAVLPPLGASLDGLCEHPICEAVLRCRALSLHPGAAGQPEHEKPSLKRDRSAGAGACDG